jgi:hypothetical protein
MAPICRDASWDKSVEQAEVPPLQDDSVLTPPGQNQGHPCEVFCVGQPRDLRGSRSSICDANNVVKLERSLSNPVCPATDANVMLYHLGASSVSAPGLRWTHSGASNVGLP